MKLNPVVYKTHPNPEEERDFSIDIRSVLEDIRATKVPLISLRRQVTTVPPPPSPPPAPIIKLEIVFKAQIAELLDDVLEILYWWKTKEDQQKKLKAEIARLKSLPHRTKVHQRALDALSAELEVIDNIFDEREEAAREAKSEVEKKSVREEICPPLKQGVDDIFEIAKTIVPVLFTLGLTGVITVPVTPLFAAGAAVVVARMTVKSFCAGVEQAEKRKKD